MFLLTGLGLLARSGTQILVIILSSRYFSPEDAGAAAFLFGTYHLLWSWLEVSITQTYYQIEQGQTQVFETLKLFTIASGLLVCTVFICLSPFFESWLPGQGATAASICAAAVFARALGVLNNARLMQTLRMKLQVPIEQVTYVVGFFSALWYCVQLDKGPYFMILGMMFASILSTGLLFLASIGTAKVRVRYQKEAAQKLAPVLSGYFVGSGLNSFVREANILMIGTFITTSAAGFYSRAVMIYMLGSYTLGQLFDSLLTPMMRRNIVKGGDNRLLFEVSTLFLTMIFVPMSIVLFLNAELIIVTLLGQEWQPATPILQVLSLAFAVRVLLKVNEATLRAYGKAWLRVRYFLVWAAILLLGAYPASQFHLAGFAAAEAIGAMVFYGLSLASAMRCVGARALQQFKWMAVALIPALFALFSQVLLYQFASATAGLFVSVTLVSVAIAITFLLSLRLRYGSLAIVRVLK